MWKTVLQRGQRNRRTGVFDVNVNNLCTYGTGPHGFGTNLKAQLCDVRKAERKNER